MSHRSVKEKKVKPNPHDEVWFSVLCQPQSGEDWDSFTKELSLQTVDRFRPTPETRKNVMDELRGRGFKVVPDPVKTKSPDPLVSAGGTVKLFEATFKVTLEKHIRHDPAIPKYLSTWFEPVAGKLPNTSEIPGAIRVALPRPPTALAPRLPIGVRGLGNYVRVPGDI